MNNFSDVMQCYAICTYLKGYGYKTQVDNNTLTCYVQDPTKDSFVVMCIPNWELAREFIKVRSQN